VQKQSDNIPQEELSEINVIPLADVCLTLVIIIMLISPMILQSMIQVQPSQAVSAPSKPGVDEKPVFVDITVQGFTINNNAVLTEFDFVRTLRNLLLDKKDKTVLIPPLPKSITNWWCARWIW